MTNFKRLLAAAVFAVALAVGLLQALADSYMPTNIPFLATGNGATALTSPSARAGRAINVVDDFGAACDVKVVTGGVITSGTNTLYNPNATFTPADVGKPIVITGAGTSGGTLATTISTYVDAHDVTLAANASTSTPNAFITDLAVATPQAGSGSYAPGDTVTLAGGTGTAAIATVYVTQVASATVNNGGSISGSGTLTVTGTTGSTPGASVGRFTATVAYSGGALQTVTSISFGSAYLTNPTSLSAEPVTGAGLTGSPTLTIKMGALYTWITPANQGSYSTLPTAPISQASTSGSGTGATFTLQSTPVTTGKIIYGTDDGAKLQLAMTSAATNDKSVRFPAGMCGTTQQIELPYNAITQGQLVFGDGMNSSFVYALAPVASVFHRSTTYSLGGGMEDMTVDGLMLATDTIKISGGFAQFYQRVNSMNGVNSQWNVGTEGASLAETNFNNIYGQTDSTTFSAAQRSTYNFYNYLWSDSDLQFSVFKNAATANIFNGAAGLNRIVGNHWYSYPLGYRAQYGLETIGQNLVSSNEMDGATIAQMYISGQAGNVTTVDNECMSYQYSIMTADCFLLISATDNNTIKDNSYNYFYPIPPAQIVVAAGSLGTHNTIYNNFGASLQQNAPATLIGQSRLPFVSPSSGSMGNNGALSGITAVPTQYANAYVCIASGVIASGSAAGCYYAIFSSTSAATLYNNVYTSGTPTIPASPTPFSTTGPGAFTGATGLVASYQITIPANAMGPNGAIRFSGLFSNNNSAGTKTTEVTFGGTTLGAVAETTNQSDGLLSTISNTGVTNSQVMGPLSYQTGSGLGAPAYSAIDTTQDQTLIFYIEHGTATDDVILNWVQVERIPGVP